MRLLLDTDVVLWQLAGSERADGARDAIELRFSAVSFAEIGVKAAVGKLTAREDLQEHVLANGVRLLALQAEHGLEVAHLPMHTATRSTGSSSHKRDVNG